LRLRIARGPQGTSGASPPLRLHGRRQAPVYHPIPEHGGTVSEYPRVPIKGIESFLEAVDLNARLSIYDQFYVWLEKTHGLKDSLGKGLPPSMHRRCFLPKSVMAEMDKLEVKRIRKVYRLSVADAKKQAAFSDGDTGPSQAKRGESAYVIDGEDFP